MDKYYLLLVAYVIFSTCIAGIIIRTTSPKHNVVAFIFCVWIIAGAVLKTRNFVIPLGSFAGFELQFERILLFSFTIYLIYEKLIGNLHTTIYTRTCRYEIYLYMYFFLSFAVMLFHLSQSLTSKDILIIYSGWLTFLVFYHTVKHSADLGFVKAIFYALLCVGVLSTLVGIIQYFIDPYFIRVGAEREAFSGRLRANGVFSAEYDNSYFLIPATVVALTTVKNKYRYPLIGIYLIGILLTFHRMSWIITILTFAGYYLFCAPKREKIFAIGGILILILIVLYIVFLLPTGLNINKDFVYNRLLQDTTSGRFNMDEMAFHRIQNAWLLGVGSVRTNTYYADMSKAGMRGFATGEIGGIHNLFLNMGYFYGLPVVISFCAFLFSGTIYFARKMKQCGSFYFIPTAAVVMFILANLSNFFYLNLDVSVLLSIILGTSIAVYQKRLNIHEIIAF